MDRVIEELKKKQLSRSQIGATPIPPIGESVRYYVCESCGKYKTVIDVETTPPPPQSSSWFWWLWG